MTISSPVATAEFSNSAGLLSAALSQHHLLGFEVIQLDFHHLHPVAVSLIMLTKAHMTHSPGCLALGE